MIKIFISTNTGYFLSKKPVDKSVFLGGRLDLFTEEEFDALARNNKFESLILRPVCADKSGAPVYVCQLGDPPEGATLAKGLNELTHSAFHAIMCLQAIVEGHSLLKKKEEPEDSVATTICGAVISSFSLGADIWHIIEWRAKDTSRTSGEISQDSPTEKLPLEPPSVN